MNLPTRQQCFKFFQEYHVPSTIVDHSLAVNKVANFIALKLKQAGVEINLDLVDRAGLLHDLLRLCDLSIDRLAKLKEYEENKKIWQRQIEKYKNYHHNQAAFEVLKEAYPELAQVILEHGFEHLDRLSSWESKIIHYADKRVDFDQIVSLDERLKRGLTRWTTKESELKKTFIKLKKLETEIFEKIGQNSDIVVK